MTAERCAACRTTRDLAELLRVTETGGLRRSKYVCRPSVDPGCFASIGPRSGEVIELAVWEPPLLPVMPPGSTHTGDLGAWKTAPSLFARNGEIG